MKNNAPKRNNFFKSRYFEIFHRIMSKEDVVKKVDSFRKDFGIPLNGLIIPGSRTIFERRQKPKYFTAKIQLIFWVIEKYKLPENTDLIEDMIVYNDNYDCYSFSPNVPKDMCRISAEHDQNLMRYKIQREDRNFIKIAVSPYASAREIKDFINKNWKQIEAIGSNLVDPYKGIVANPNREIHALIYELNKGSKKDLESYINETWPTSNDDGPRVFSNKPQVIAYFVKNQYSKHRLTHEEEIRRIIKQEKQRRKPGMMDVPIANL